LFVRVVGEALVVAADQGDIYCCIDAVLPRSPAGDPIGADGACWYP
jgi:hypothetical protein